MAQKALNNQMTRTVRVNRKRLIETLMANRTDHIKQFNEAMAGYKATALAKVDEAFNGLAARLATRKAELVKELNSFTAETADNFTNHLTILQAVTVNMEVPTSYEGAYDAAIDMANFDTREELELSGSEFQCFCRDVWDWTYGFTRTTEAYGAVGAAR